MSITNEDRLTYLMYTAEFQHHDEYVELRIPTEHEGECVLRQHLIPLIDSRIEKMRLEEEPKIQFTQPEIEQMLQMPEVLESLADWHEVQRTMADAIDMKEAFEGHTNRKQELKAAAKYFLEKMENDY